jgi:hypothetical protein
LGSSTSLVTPPAVGGGRGGRFLAARQHVHAVRDAQDHAVAARWAAPFFFGDRLGRVEPHDEREANKSPGFLPEARCMFMSRSVTTCTLPFF